MRISFLRFILVLILICPTTASAGTYYVSSTGEATWANCEDAAGTPGPKSGIAACPLTESADHAVAGDLVYIRAGTYTGIISAANSGNCTPPTFTNACRIRIQNYPDELVVFAGSTIPILLSKSYWKISGVDVGATKGITINAPVQRPMLINSGASYNEISGINFDGGGSVDPIKMWDGTGAAGTLTMSGVAIANETFVVGTQTFTWKETRSGAGEVTIGSTAGAACTNIVTALDTDIPSEVYATCNTGTGVVTIRDLTENTDGTSVPLSESSTNMAVSPATGFFATTGTPCLHNWIHDNIFANQGGVNSCSDDGGTYIGLPFDDGHSNNTTIENNVFSCGGHHNLEIYTKYNVLRNNVFHHEGCMTNTEGVCTYGGDDPTIEAISGKYGNRNIQIYDSFARDGKFNIIEGNRFGHAGPPPDDDGGDGMTITAPKNIFRYNAIFNAQNNGIYFKYGSRSYSDNNRVYNNTIYRNGRYDNRIEGAGLWQGYGVRFIWSGGTNPQDNVLKNNLLYGNVTGTFLYGGTSEADNTIENNLSDGTDPKFTDTTLTSFSSTTLPNLNLQSDSGAINMGVGAGYGALTTVHADDTGSGTTLKVADALYFQDGTWGSSLSNIQADWICVGTVTNCVQIDGTTPIDYTSTPNVITLTEGITRSNGQSIWLYRKSDGTRVLHGSAPDYGAYEYDSSLRVPFRTVN